MSTPELQVVVRRRDQTAEWTDDLLDRMLDRLREENPGSDPLGLLTAGLVLLKMHRQGQK